MPRKQKSEESARIDALLANPVLAEGDILLQRLHDRTLLQHISGTLPESDASFLDQIWNTERQLTEISHEAHRALSLASSSPEWLQTATDEELAQALERTQNWAEADPQRFAPIAEELERMMSSISRSNSPS